jgi:hypothetical protein
VGYHPQSIPELLGDVDKGRQGTLGGRKGCLHGCYGVCDHHMVQEGDSSSEIGNMFLGHGGGGNGLANGFELFLVNQYRFPCHDVPQQFGLTRLPLGDGLGVGLYSWEGIPFCLEYVQHHVKARGLFVPQGWFNGQPRVMMRFIHVEKIRQEVRTMRHSEVARYSRRYLCRIVLTRSNTKRGGGGMGRRGLCFEPLARSRDGKKRKSRGK